MGRRLPLDLALIVLALSPVPAAADVFRDDFTAARGRYELLNATAWSIGGGLCRFSSAHEGEALVTSDEVDRARSTATLCVARRLAPGWATAGLTLYVDGENHWRLLLVIGPDNQRYFELIERYRGVHQAQTAGTAAGTRLAMRQEGELHAWEFGQAYRLTLTLSPQAIAGEIRDPHSGRFWRRTFLLAHGKAVRSGRPGLSAAGLEAAFREFVVESERATPAETLRVPAGRCGSALIVGQPAGRLTTGLASLLGGAGFGVRVADWEALARARIAASAVDLLVLADARRVPAAAVRPIEAFLRARGKLVSVGAPAFGHLLLKGPRGYVDAEQFADALYAAAARRPLRLDAKGWRRTTNDANRPATILPDPAAGPTAAWRISLDYDAWDSFGHDIGGAFAGAHGLLCFTARGDAHTPQLSIECRERDGSRWMATVPLATEWRRYVLRPSDFNFWRDSKSKRDPASGFRPADAVALQIGLSRSHTPHSKPGPHTLWIADLSTAADPAGDQPDPRTPEIQTLSPSFMLYPVDDAASFAVAHVSVGVRDARAALSAKALCPVGREAGQGFDRGRPLRWIRLLDACDGSGRNRGALLWLTVGQHRFPGAMWLSLGLADPEQLLADGRPAALRDALVSAVKAMTRGTWLLEGGARYFSRAAGEAVDLGGLVLNAGRHAQELSARLVATDARGQRVLERPVPLHVPAGEQQPFALRWDPPASALFPLRVTVELCGAGGVVLDRIAHALGQLPSRPAEPSEFVTVEGSRFMLGGKPWTMRGMNYYANTQGGRKTTPLLDRDTYDPDVVERDLAWMESIGINLLSGVRGPQPEDPHQPGAFRDLHDFLERCRRHGMKVFYFLPFANPLAGGDVEKVKRHIAAAGIQRHPAILAWELSWEPIYYAGPAGGKMDFLAPDWNAWIAERYGSLADAERDWGFRLDRAPRSREAALPRHEWLVAHGPWDRAVAAFRRFFDDRVGRAYGQTIRQLHRFDPHHLVTFRFGACGIPDKARFAHAHSAAVAKHVSFLCPEGYNLQTGGWATPTPADDVRKGGLVTLYYRFLSREKPVVWMEFGYTVNGFHRPWRTGAERIAPIELARQRAEYENFFRMFVESGARGAAPWWLPGGFRLGEQSDFGVLEPDGSERPVCQVLREYFPRLPASADPTCVATGPVSASAPGVLHLDFDAHYADAWDYYSPQYLAAVRAGRLPTLGTEGTGTTSANCPLKAVGNTPCTGRNPPRYLNAEFEGLQIQESSQSPWRDVRSGEAITIPRSGEVCCRATLGNTGEAAWLAPPAGVRLAADGTVWLHVLAGPAGPAIDVPIAGDTPYLASAAVHEFRLPPMAADLQTATLQLITRRRTTDGKTLELPFGEKATIACKR